MTRIAHYVRSSHWDREWYEPMQHLRMRLVAMLDEVLDGLDADAEFRFVMDGQSIPIEDYLEIRPERVDDVRSYVRAGRLRLGPWYVAPDEWLVSGESLLRNLEMGIAVAESFGGSSRAGFVCDQFGHIGQLPQIFAQCGITAAYVWRGTNERDHAGHFLWRSPDGTTLPTYRFGLRGYGGFPYFVRSVFADDGVFDPAAAVDKVVTFTRAEAARSPVSPILLFDGVDHLEIEPRMAVILTAANRILAADDIKIVNSDLEAYQADLLRHTETITRTLVGELRYTCGEPGDGEEQWMLGGTYASRIPLKQQNAACEDELCLWAEPFSAFVATALGRQYPEPFLRLAWRHLLQNHPHDSMCGCSTDAVHRDMIYRFDQSMQIASKLTENALAAITAAAAQSRSTPPPVTIGIFNATAEAIDEPVDFDVLLPNDWPTKYSDNFASDPKFAFRLRGPDGDALPYQLLAQRANVKWRRTLPYKLSYEGTQHLSRVAARVRVPAFGYTTLSVEPSDVPTRYASPRIASPRSLENERLRITVNPNGTLQLKNIKTGHCFKDLLTYEECADIGNGWFHGMAVNDRQYSNAAAAAEVSIVAAGPLVGTLRIETTLHVPAAFDFYKRQRAQQTVALRIVSDVTLRQDADRVEITTTVENTACDHRLRVLFPTGLAGDVFSTDAPFDVVDQTIQHSADNDRRREMELDVRPQQSWTAFGDGRHGLAVVCRGLPEVAVLDTPDRPIALTLFRGFGSVISRDDDTGGQVLGTHVFRYTLVPFEGPVPVRWLFLLGQRAGTTVRQATHTPADRIADRPLAATGSFLDATGDVVITSVRQQDDAVRVRGFNPNTTPTEFRSAGGRPIVVDAKRIFTAEVLRPLRQET